MFNFFRKKIKVIFVGRQDDQILQEIKNFFKKNSRLELEIKFFDNFNDFYSSASIKKEKINFFVTNLLSQKTDLTNSYKPIKFITLEDFYIYLYKKIPIEFIDKESLLKLISKKPPFYFILIKRFFDILLAIIILIIVLFLLPIIILGIKLSSPGPIFIKQKRMGRFNKIITVYKFRTMRIGEDEKSKDGYFWASINDQRIFPFGKFLRKIHLDEMPQVINILKGEMSIIGPRAFYIKVIDDLKNKIPYFEFRHLVKPGLAGWALICCGYGSSEKDYVEKISYDLYYIANQSLIFDFFIFFKTLFKEVFYFRGN